jgi:hypothetical protein
MFLTLSNPTPRDRVHQGVSVRVTEGLRDTYELPLIHKDGSERIIQLNAAPLYGDRRAISWWHGIGSKI